MEKFFFRKFKRVKRGGKERMVVVGIREFVFRRVVNIKNM